MNYPQLYWSYEKKGRSRVHVSVTVNQPFVGEFRIRYNGIESDERFATIHMVHVQAATIFYHTQQEIDLRKIYKYLENNIPKQNT